jgi:hypothetical protein
MAKSRGLVSCQVSCVGVSPMLLNPMTDATLDQLIHGSGGRSKQKNTDISQREMAEAKLPRGANGEFGFPLTYLFAALVGAGRQVIYDQKKKFSTLKDSLVPGLITLSTGLFSANGDEFIPFVDQKQEWVVDKRRGVLAATGVAVGIIRPKFPVWAFDVTVEVDEGQVNIAKVRELFEAAGRFSGIGDFRPARRGPFGRFKVTKFVEVEAEPLKQAA